MNEVAPITGSMLHDLVACERRVRHDLHQDAASRDPVGDFVRMLWAEGREHEADVIAGLTGAVADLRRLPLATRASDTLSAMLGDAELILGGKIELDDLVGMPDLLRRSPEGWVAGDVKSGVALEPDGRRPRREYAVQVAFYAGMLAAKGHGPPGTAFVVDRRGDTVDYDLLTPWGRSGTSLARMTEDLVAIARAIRDGAAETRGALSAACKMCHWHTLCERELVAQDDLTLVAGVGRAVRDAIAPVAPTVLALAGLAMPPEAAGPRTPGVGAERLSRFRDRARLLATPGSSPYAIRPLVLPAGRPEIHFDIEADPSRDGFVYLHGFLRREAGRREGVYSSIFAECVEDERDAFAEAMRHLTADPDAVIYYYSKYERSSFRALQARHPDVCSAADVERLYDPATAIDLLFDVIMPHTEWPTRNLSIKTLARYLGFQWGDKDASGANSIAWFDEFARTGDPAVRKRIIDYNADDVRASAVVLDGLRALPVGRAPTWPPPSR